MATSDNTSHTLILASGSPRRAQMMRELGFTLNIITSDIPEFPQPGEDPTSYTMRLARQKAHAVAEQVSKTAEHLPDCILSADTIVVNAGEVLEKPQDEEEAFAMLRGMSGGNHEVITSFCVMSRATNQSIVKAVQTTVHFRELSDAAIWAYVKSGEPMDKAGGYGIQGVAAAFVSQIEGSYSSVVGLPLCEVVVALEALGVVSDFPSQTPQPS